MLLLNFYWTKIKNWLKKKPRYSILLVLVIVLAALVRYWRLESLFHWTLDEAFWTYLPHQVATFKNFPMIGGHIGGTGVYSGPLFVWLMGVVLFFLHSNPLAIAFFVSTLGIVSTGLTAVLFKQKKQKYLSLVAALLYATSTLVTLYDRKYWNASFAALSGILSMYLVSELALRPSWKKLGLTTVVLALAIHAHMTGLVLVVFGFVYLLVHRVKSQWLIGLFLGLVLTHVPLLVFDLRHDFSNSKALVAFITGSESNTLVPHLSQVVSLTLNTYGRLLYLPGKDISNELTLCSQMATSRSLAPWGYLLLAVIVLGYSLTLLRQKQASAVLLWTNIVLVACYQFLSPETFYPGQLSEYYFLPSFAAFLLIFADLLVKLSQKVPVITWGLVTLLVIVNLHTTLNLKHSFGLATKIGLVDTAIEQLDDKKFALEIVGPECQIYGVRYLFDWRGYPPVESYEDPILGWLYQEELSDESTQLVTLDIDSGKITVESLVGSR